MCLVTHSRLSDYKPLLPKPLTLRQLPLYSHGTWGKAQNHLGPGLLLCRKSHRRPSHVGVLVKSVCQKVLYFVLHQAGEAGWCSGKNRAAGLTKRLQDFKRNSDRVAPHLNTGLLRLNWASQEAQWQKKIHLPKQKLQEMWVWFLGQEDPLELETATHSSILAWKIPWTEEPGGLQSMESPKRAGHDLATKQQQSYVILIIAVMQNV